MSGARWVTRRLPRRGVTALVVSGSASASGLLVAVAVARTSTVDETGRFGIAAAAVLLVTALARSAVTDPLIAEAGQRPLNTRYLGRASVIGLVGAGALLVAAVALRSEFLVIGTIAAHGLTVRESVRAVLVACGRARIAIGIEGVWLVSSGLALTGTLIDVWDGTTAFGIWAASGAVLGYVAAGITRSDVLPAWGRTPVPTGRSAAFASDTLIGSGVVQLVTWIATAIGGLTVAAALRGAGTLAGPVTVGLAAARSVLIPRSVSHLGSGQAVRRLATDSAVMSCVALPPLVALAFIPDSIGGALLGDTWRLVAPILPLTALELFFQLVASVPEAAHRALGRGQRIVSLRCLSAAVRVPAVIAVAPLGAGAVVTAATCVTVLSATAWWWSLVTLTTRATSVDGDVGVTSR